jgi:cardiolipin synthase
LETQLQTPAALGHETDLLSQAFTRAAGAPLVPGHDVQLLKDGTANYPAWLDAIRHANSKIYFENYFIQDDVVGAEFAAALAERARVGVHVRVIYDWLGSLNRTSRNFWRSLTDAGAEVRCFNAPRLDGPTAWLHRNHRKMLAVDGHVGFITGLCVGKPWVGDAASKLDPWRDTGVQIKGPALYDIERAFARSWAATGGAAIAESELCARDTIKAEGPIALRVVATIPGESAIFRLDQLIAAAARRTLWLTDAYFAGVPPYVEALRSAALDGVDVRLLVPGASDIPLLRPLSQAGYRPLLEAGIRVFEWNGAMLHAKTAVADGMWARVGSSNLNIASWIGNYELDAVIEDERFAQQMEEMYERDLENATEIVLHPRERRRRIQRLRQQLKEGRIKRPLMRRHASGSASRATAGALRLGRTVGAALSQQRILATNEAGVVAAVGAAFVLIALACILWPQLAAIPVAVIVLWLAAALLLRARELRRERRSRGLPTTQIARRPSPAANAAISPGAGRSEDGT